MTPCTCELTLQLPVQGPIRAGQLRVHVTRRLRLRRLAQLMLALPRRMLTQQGSSRVTMRR